MLEQEMANLHSDLLLAELQRSIKASKSENTVISIEDTAEKCRVPVEAVLRIVKSEFRRKDEEDANFLIVGKFLIPTSKANELRSLLDRDKITKYNEASSLFTKNGVPEECHADLISKLGFEIVWKGIDYNTATIEKKY
jgi:hypothetical protein